MIKKHPIPPLLLVLFLVLQLVIGPQITLGAETTATISLEQAVQIVKDAFPVPQHLTRFSSGFNEDYSGRKSYSLNWTSPDEPYGSMSAQVDAESGSILNMNIWENSRDQNPMMQFPLLTRSEAKQIATEMVNKLAGEHASELMFIEDDEALLSFSSYEPYRYNFRWIRMINDIPFPSNSLSVGVRGDNGQVVNYYFNWAKGIELPDTTTIVPLEEAKEVFVNTPMLELQYFMPYPRTPDEDRPLSISLVYQLKSEYYGGAIDALTGKPLSLDDLYNGALGKANSSLKIQATQTTQATSSASSEINSDVSPNVKISKEQAEAIVEELIDIPSNLTLRGINLNPDWRDNTKQIWNLDWNAAPTAPKDYQFMNAQIDADSGELISFNLSGPNGQGIPDIDRKEAQALAEEFLEKASPNRINELKLNTNYYFPKTETMTYFNYTRLVNGIPFPRNTINIGIDTVNKRVINYNSEWISANFPSPSQAFGLGRAIEIFLEERPLELNYTQIYKPEGSYEIRLVYQPRVPYDYPGTQMISATTGEPLDYDGRTKGQWPKPYLFSDIDGHDAQKEIELLGQVGAFGEFGENFKPDEAIKTSNLMRAMLVARFGAWEKTSLSDEAVMKEAKTQGWINEDVYPSSELSRLDLLRIMIRLMGMEAAAQVPGIYHLSFKDLGNVPSDAMGYLALGWGLDLLRAEGWNFRAEDKATRAEAAYALVHALRIKQQQIRVMPY